MVSRQTRSKWYGEVKDMINENGGDISKPFNLNNIRFKIVKTSRGGVIRGLIVRVSVNN